MKNKDLSGCLKLFLLMVSILGFLLIFVLLSCNPAQKMTGTAPSVGDTITVSYEVTKVRGNIIITKKLK